MSVRVSDDALFVVHQPRSSTLTVMYNLGRLWKNNSLHKRWHCQKHLLFMLSTESKSHWSEFFVKVKVVIPFACCCLNGYVPLIVCLPLSPPTIPGWVISSYTHRETVSLPQPFRHSINWQNLTSSLNTSWKCQADCIKWTTLGSVSRAACSDLHCIT